MHECLAPLYEMLDESAHVHFELPNKCYITQRKNGVINQKL